MRAESPLRRFVRSNRLNPLPHAGTISVFLLIVVVVTGVYLTFFFEFGFEASFRAVAKLEDHPIQRVMRGIHRFASAALVVTTIVHAWRVFVMQRFTGPRRWRWLTGVLALFVVWLAGVTGYWLIWDERAQVLNEATGALLAPVWPSLSVGVATQSGSGWPWLLGIWFAHLLLTGVVGWALWRHVRKTRHRWLPPRRWMWVMFGALSVASIAFPAGMLPPADPTVIPGDIPLDPFVMFLLPPLLSPWRWLAVAGGAFAGAVISGLPWFLSREQPPIAEVVDENCTGCELCVLDCPYLAVFMSGEGEGAVAVVDPDRCVGCAICLGSCAFDAITGLGDDAWQTMEISGPVVLVCSRQARLQVTSSGMPTTIEVPCTGALNPRAVGSVTERGATSVQVVGCPPGDCAYGIGNQVTAERLTGARRPLLPRRWQASVIQDWVSPTELRAALTEPGLHTAADIESAPPGWRVLVPVVLVVLGSVVAIRFATDAPFLPQASDAVVRVVLDHVPGQRLEGQDAPSAGPARLEVVFGGQTVSVVDLGEADRLLEVVDVQVTAGRADLGVFLIEGGTSNSLFGGAVDLEAGRRLVIEARDAPPEPGLTMGRELFEGAGLGSNLGCDICHSLEPGRRGVGPSLAGIADVAALRVPGVSAEEYLRQSIIDPDAYIVEGFRAGQMLPVYEERLTASEIDALVAYLLSLTEVVP